MFDTVTSELPRDRWGRPLITPPEGGAPVAYTRVTTFAKAIDDTFHLSKWQQRMTALGMSRRPDLVLAAAAVTDPDNPSQKRLLNDTAAAAIDAAGAGARATAGTALHSFTEVIDLGQPLPPNVPEQYVGTLDAYRRAIRFFKIRKMEGFCIVDDLAVGGSYDRILEATEEGLDEFERATGRRMCYPTGEEVRPGDVIIGDLKTGKSVDFGAGAISIQLGLYANAVDYDHTLGSRTPLPGNPRKDWGLVLHVPAGGGVAYMKWVNIAAGWETARDVLPLVHAWRKRRDLFYDLHSETVGATSGPSLTEQIHGATSGAALRALYAQNRDKWTPGLTALSKERLVALGEA